MTDPMQFNPECICRICLSESHQMIGIFNDQSSENIPNILMFFASIKISIGDGLPNQICSMCMFEANNAYFFKQKCEESDKFLRNTLQQEQQQQQQQQQLLQHQNVLYISHIETSEDSMTKGSASETVTEMIRSTDLNNDVFCDFFNNDESITTTEIVAIDPFKSLSSSIDNNALSVSQSHIVAPLESQSELITRLQYSDQLLHLPEQCEMNNYNGDDIVKMSKISKKQKADKKITKLKSNIVSTISGNSISSSFGIINKLHCNECDEIFDKKIDLRRHLAVDHVLVDGERNFKCIECNKLYATDFILNIHMKTHNNKEYPCENCAKIFYRLDKLVEHKKRHSNERSHICPKCGKGFYNKYYLDRHMQIHERDHLERPIYECSVCGKKMAHSNHLQVHMRAHLDRVGPLTNNTMNSDSVVEIDRPGDRIINNESSLLPSSIQNIELLDIAAGDNNSLLPSSSITAILKQKKIILCSVCGKSCSSRSNLAVHMRRHTGKMTNFCKICGKGYPRTTDLTVHMRKHTGEKPFQCQICSRNFARSDKLAVHMRTHTGEKPYVCNCCGRAFAQSNDLASHKRRNVCQASQQSQPPPLQQTQFNDFQLPTPSSDINNVKSMYFIARKGDNTAAQSKLFNFMKTTNKT